MNVLRKFLDEKKKGQEFWFTMIFINHHNIILLSRDSENDNIDTNVAELQ